MPTRTSRGCAAALLLIPAFLSPPATAQTLSTVPLSEQVMIDGVRMAADGTLVAASGWSGQVLYRVDADGRVSVLADGLAGPIQSVVDDAGRTYVTNYSDAGSVAVIEPGSAHATKLATVPQGAAGIALGPDGNLYVSIYGDAGGSGDSIWRVSRSGDSEVFVQGEPIAAPIGLAFDDAGMLYAVNSRDGRVHRIAPDGSIARLAELPSGSGFFASGHLIFGNGRLYASGNHHHRVYEIGLDGTVRVLAGTGEPGHADGPLGTGTLAIPNGIALSLDGTRLWVVPGGPTPRTAIRSIDLRRGAGQGQS